MPHKMRKYAEFNLLQAIKQRVVTIMVKQLKDCSDDETDYDSDESMGSLKDFIASEDGDDDDGEVATAMIVNEDEPEVEPENILPAGSKRKRSAPVRYVDPNYRALMLEDADEGHIFEKLTAADECHTDDENEFEDDE